MEMTCNLNEISPVSCGTVFTSPFVIPRRGCVSDAAKQDYEKLCMVTLTGAQGIVSYGFVKYKR
jgi:hypothetical protein